MPELDARIGAMSADDGGSVPVANDHAEAFKQMHQIAETELVFGLVGALGTNIEMVSEQLHLALEEMSYQTREIRLSGLLREIEWDQPLDERAKLDSYIAAHMDAGDRLRSEWDRPDALALLAVAKIVAERDALMASGEPLSRQAWVLRQLKTPDEVQALRDTYGSRFFLVAAYTPDDERTESLEGA